MKSNNEPPSSDHYDSGQDHLTLPSLLLSRHNLFGTTTLLPIAFLLPLSPIDTTVSLLSSHLPSSFFSSTPKVPASNNCSPVVPLQILAPSAAELACSETIAGTNFAKTSFITSSEEHMIATLNSRANHRSVKVPDSCFCISITLISRRLKSWVIRTRHVPLLREMRH
jgi:hypothetical protein